MVGKLTAAKTPSIAGSPATAVRPAAAGTPTSAGMRSTAGAQSTEGKQATAMMQATAVMLTAAQMPETVMTPILREFFLIIREILIGTAKIRVKIRKVKISTFLTERFQSAQ